jgi:hypothetical protein
MLVTWAVCTPEIVTAARATAKSTACSIDSVELPVSSIVFSTMDVPRPRRHCDLTRAHARR